MSTFFIVTIEAESLNTPPTIGEMTQWLCEALDKTPCYCAIGMPQITDIALAEHDKRTALLRDALSIIEDAHPELYPNEKTDDMFIYVTCERIRHLLAEHGGEE